jgi:hypothetical protein
MKDKVTVDGVVLTRAQIEAAVRELDAEPVDRELTFGFEGFRQTIGDKSHYYFPLDPEDIRHVAQRLEKGHAPGVVIDADGSIYLSRYLEDAPVTTAIRKQNYTVVRIASLNVTEVTE